MSFCHSAISDHWWSSGKKTFNADDLFSNLLIVLLDMNVIPISNANPSNNCNQLKDTKPVSQHSKAPINTWSITATRVKDYMKRMTNKIKTNTSSLQQNHSTPFTTSWLRKIRREKYWRCKKYEFYWSFANDCQQHVGMLDEHCELWILCFRSDKEKLGQFQLEHCQ